MRYFGVTIDCCYLTLLQHVPNVYASASVELRRIASIRQYLSCDATKTLISASPLPFLLKLSANVIVCLQEHPTISSINSRGCRILPPGLLFDAVGKITSLLFSVPFICFQYHVGLSTRSHLCVIALFLKVFPGICQNDCINTHLLVSLARLLTVLRFVYQLQTDRLSEKGPSPSLAPQS